MSNFRFRELNKPKKQDLEVYLTVMDNKVTLNGRSEDGRCNGIVSIDADGSLKRHNLQGNDLGLSYQKISQGDFRIRDTSGLQACPHFIEDHVCMWRDGEECKKEACLKMRDDD